MLALALSLLSLGASVTAQGLLETPKPVCPLASGTFNELYAVAIYLANEDLMEEAELCLVDAIAASMPAFTLLSDINTVNDQHARAARVAGIIDTMVNNADAKLFHAKKLLQNGEHAVAAGLLEVVAVNNPALASVRHLLGVAQFGSGKNEEAEANLKAAAELEPDNELYTNELENLEKALKGELPVQVEAAAAAAAAAAAGDVSK